MAQTRPPRKPSVIIITMQYSPNPITWFEIVCRGGVELERQDHTLLIQAGDFTKRVLLAAVTSIQSVSERVCDAHLGATEEY